MNFKRLKLAISPCPNDTFIFGAWINSFIKSDLECNIETDYLDIEELNEQSIHGNYDIIKISAAHIPKIIHNYSILNTGAAMTDKMGPLLISKKYTTTDQIDQMNIVLPGIHTTAAFLLQFLFPGVKKLKYRLFSEIEKAILDDEADAGVIIHESRFSYESKGLLKLLDLGEAWYAKTKSPIPLGVIAVKRNLEKELKLKIQEQIKKSIAWAYENKEQLMPFIRSKATEMELSTIEKHIDLYVNSFSQELGEKGRSAILKLSNFISRGNLDPEKIFL